MNGHVDIETIISGVTEFIAACLGSNCNRAMSQILIHSSRAGLSLSDARGTDRVGGPLLTKAKLKAGSHPRNNKLFFLQMVQIE